MKKLIDAIYEIIKGEESGLFKGKYATRKSIPSGLYPIPTGYPHQLSIIRIH